MLLATRKQKRKILGQPLYPIRIGNSAVIQMGDSILRTSQVVRLTKCKMDSF